MNVLERDDGRIPTVDANCELLVVSGGDIFLEPFSRDSLGKDKNGVNMLRIVSSGSSVRSVAFPLRLQEKYDNLEKLSLELLTPKEQEFLAAQVAEARRRKTAIMNPSIKRKGQPKLPCAG